MISVVISDSAFQQNANVCLQLTLQNAKLNNTSANTLLIDKDLLLNYKNNSYQNIPFIEINLKEWLSQDKPCRMLINKCARSLDPERIIILDARHYDAQLILTTLHEIANVWFHLTSWQKAFVLIVDDYLILRFATELAHTFYIQSTCTSHIQDDVKAMKKAIWSFCWLGTGRLSIIFHALCNFPRKIKHYVKKRFI